MQPTLHQRPRIQCCGGLIVTKNKIQAAASYSVLEWSGDYQRFRQAAPVLIKRELANKLGCDYQKWTRVYRIFGSAAMERCIYCMHVIFSCMHEL